VLVPPGRLGAQPSLSIGYSSEAPIYGGLASGWTLSGVPMVGLDTSQGRLVTTSPSDAPKTYQSSMAGGRPLVTVEEPHDAAVAQTFRPQSDASGTRYELIKWPNNTLKEWRARSTDCRREGTGTQVDHAISRKNMGNATLDNAQLACPHCNASKGAGTFPKTPAPGYEGPWPPPHWYDK
jgi:hypothetical protein